MATNSTCTACSRALARSCTAAVPTCQSAFGRAQRNFSIATPRLYHATQNRASKAGPEVVKKPAPAVLKFQSKFMQKVREKAPLMTETYVAYGATGELIKACSEPGDYKIPQALVRDGVIPTDEDGTHIGEADSWWYQELGLKPTFSNWTQITFLHMYMLQVRFRMFPKTHAPVWIQHLTNQAFYAAEDRLVIWHKYTANSLRQKQLKDMFAQWRGVLLSYDEGLVKGDAVLAAAIWRNLLNANEKVDFEKLAQIVAYLRRELKRLDSAADVDILGGQWIFPGSPGDEAGHVRAPSRLAAIEATKKA